MGVFRRAVLAAAVFFVVPGAPHEGPNTPLPPRIVRAERPMAETWTKRSARLSAVALKLNALGAHTHANWVFYRLPFDTTELDRIRDVSFTPSAASDPNVSALRIGSVCLPWMAYGPMETWGSFTVGGVGVTLPFDAHHAPPTDDPTILGILVPTRVANYIACGRDEGRFSDLDFWQLDVSWEER